MGIEQRLTSEDEIEAIWRQHGREGGEQHIIQTHVPMDRTIDKKNMMLGEVADKYEMPE